MPALTTVMIALALTGTHPAPRYAAAPDLSGTYLLDRSKSDDPKKSLEDATSSMRRFKRNAVRKRLSDALTPSDTLRIEMHADTVALATSGRLHLSTLPGGEAKTRTGEKGGTVSLASAWEGDTLVVKTTAEKFQREARYSLDSDAIRVAITMSGAGGGNPIHYVLEYRRVAT